MGESSLGTIRGLLEESIEECENDECNFRIRTALQLLEAVEAELRAEELTPDLLETLAEDDDLEERLRDAGVLDS
ncbi:MAG: hypothetical protein ACOCY6_05490 [Halodesulfurarchaeum sp.]